MLVYSDISSLIQPYFIKKEHSVPKPPKDISSYFEESNSVNDYESGVRITYTIQ